MGVILKSSWEGIGSLALYSFLDSKKLPHSKMFDPFIYGTFSGLASRLIEYQGKKHYEKGGVCTIITVISLRILSPYLLRPLLKKGLNIEISIQYIHIENGIYLLALADGEYERLAARMTQAKKSSRHYWRVAANVMDLLERRYCSLFD